MLPNILTLPRMTRPLVPPGLLILTLVLSLVLPCTAPQPACEAMGAIFPCEDGRAPRCRADNVWRTRGDHRIKNWDVTCGYEEGKRSKLLYMYVPVWALGGSVVLVFAAARLVRRRRVRPSPPKVSS